MRGTGPRVTPRADGSVLVSNTEFITDLQLDGGITGLDINPGLATFPWLSRLAANYEVFRVRRMVFKFNPTCSSSTGGVVALAVDYDSNDPAPPDKASLSAYSGAVRVNVWSPCQLVVRPTNATNWLFCAPDINTTNPANTDIKLYQVGKLWVGLFNTSTTGTAGELIVDYDIEFSKPQVSGGIGPSARVVAANIQPPNSLFGAGTTITGSAQMSVSGGTGLKVKVAGQFIISVSIAYAAPASVLPLDILLNGSVAYVSRVETANQWVSSNNAAANITYEVAVSPNDLLSFVLAASVTAVTYLQIRFSNYPKTLG